MSSRQRADAYVRGLIAANPNLLVPHYLIHSWLYYERDLTVISDTLYDHLCAELQAKLPALSHPHKHLVDPEALRAGTAYHLRDQYPAIVPGAAMELFRMFNNGSGRRPRRATKQR